MKIEQLDPIEDSFKPLKFEDIKKIEDIIGKKLPKQYVEFIQRFGRCGFLGEATVVTENENYPIFTFYGSGTGSGSLIRQLDLHPDLRDDGKLPIADDLFNNIYVLDVNLGRIYYIVYLQGHAKAKYIATSFSDFINKIEVIPDE